MAIGTPTQDDHDVRLHRLVCCIAEKGATLAKRLQYGTASECEISKFETLVAMQRSLHCYQVCVPEVLATGTIGPFVLPAQIMSISLYNGATLISNRTGYAGVASWSTIMADVIADAIALGYVVTYTSDGKNSTIYVKAPVGTGDSLNGTTLTLTISYGLGTPNDVQYTGTLSGGVDEDCSETEADAYNCLTREDIDSMWEYVSQECDICFAPYGSEYTDPRL